MAQTKPFIPITREAYDELIAICKRSSPNEACGLLLTSDISGENQIIDAVQEINNAHEVPQRAFQFEPASWTSAFFEARKNRQRIAGFFHSHPSSAAIPSHEDEIGLPLADEGLCYWIVSLQNAAAPAVQPYIRLHGQFMPDPLMFA
ncbi:Mov34/MPN/PAD-1 family protein [Paenibacillus radicis (ex Gao et al. 2016)]|uniref:Mov34/MPN/PAD-1 family protein n=1 Tax=Paenibacillus radicis (ex Gao et al. 2016) TaxID=1737354 RepID=UPI00166C9CA2|nr:M67 family metallopeptidase [Paenibacillus radicis (ex Gao et al. 2016)]